MNDWDIIDTPFRRAIRLFNRYYKPENGKLISKAEARRRVREKYPEFV